MRDIALWSEQYNKLQTFKKKLLTHSPMLGPCKLAISREEEHPECSLDGNTTQLIRGGLVKALDKAMSRLEEKITREVDKQMQFTRKILIGGQGGGNDE